MSNRYKELKEQQYERGQVSQSARVRLARRNFLAFSVWVGVGALLAACGGENESVAEDDAKSCAERASMSLSQRANRTALSYVEVSDNPQETCANCRYFEQPDTTGMCGGCTIVSGPIAPEGYCTAWAPTET